MNVQTGVLSQHLTVQGLVNASNGKLDCDAVVSVLQCTGAWPQAFLWGYVLYKMKGNAPSVTCEWAKGGDRSVRRDCEHLIESLETVKDNPGLLPVQMKDQKLRETFEKLGVTLPDILKGDLLRASIRVWIVFSVVGDANEGADRISIRVAKKWLHL